MVSRLAGRSRARLSRTSTSATTNHRYISLSSGGGSYIGKKYNMGRVSGKSLHLIRNVLMMTGKLLHTYLLSGQPY